jgi:hypothetical protein
MTFAVQRDNVKLRRHGFLEKVNVRNVILVIFEVLKAVTIKSSVLWNAKSCGPVGIMGVSGKHTIFIFSKPSKKTSKQSGRVNKSDGK